MTEIVGDIWEKAEELHADALCIPTNLSLTKTGSAVMGAGLALECETRLPGCDTKLGACIKEHPTRLIFRIGRINYGATSVLSFPTKRSWRVPARLDLIEKSALELRDYIVPRGIELVLLPRVGCGLGSLSWISHVKPLLTPLLDDRFVVVSKE